MVTFPPNLICHTTVSPLARSISSDVRLLLPIACSAAVLMASARPSWADGSLQDVVAGVLSSEPQTLCVEHKWTGELRRPRRASGRPNTLSWGQLRRYGTAVTSGGGVRLLGLSLARLVGLAETENQA